LASDLSPSGAKPSKASQVKRRFLIAVIGLSVLTLVVNVAATQFLAWGLHYHPALGEPLIGNIYPPWRWLEWRAVGPGLVISAPSLYDPGLSGLSYSLVFAFLDMGLYGGGALLTLLLLGAVSQSSRRKPVKHEDVHGTARFGTDADLRHAGLLPEPEGRSEGVYCGAWPDKRGTLHYLRHNGAEHVLALGPIRSGKLVGLVIPTLTTWPHSAVVYDEKGEIFEATSGWRASEGQNRVLRWEPGALEGTISFNFLGEVRLGTEYEFRDVSNVMEMVVDPEGAGLSDHWKPSAAVTLNGVALHVCYERQAMGQTASLGDVLHALNDPNRGRDLLYDAMRTNKHLGGQPHPQIAAVGQDMMNKDVRERSGIHSTASLMLRLFRDPIVAANTARSDFRLDELMNAADPATLYVVTRGEDKLRLRPLVRLFLTMMFNRLLSADMRYENGQPVSPHRHRLLVLVDEFASLRRMEAVQEAMSKCAGYGIKVYLLVQDREQLIAEYGQNETITSHCHIKAAYAPTNYHTAEWLSDLSGNATVVVEDVTESGSPGSMKKNTSRSYRTVSRPLITPDEVMRLKAPRKDGDGKIVEAGQVLIFAAGSPPVLAVQSLFFRDPEFLRRVSIPTPSTP
jgi:type IV secretion system protein VirD4